MKKALSLVFCVIFILPQSCNKDETDLKDAIAGNWITPTMYSNYFSTPCKYYLTLTDTMWYSIYRGHPEINWGMTNWEYSIDEEDRTITIKSVDGNDTDVTFSIFLTDNPDMMIWMTEQPGGETFIWERGEFESPFPPKAATTQRFLP